ncbi:predicted protein [Naegleria gruberi]|uniref:Predicted protein n=1 Tax=Naegleria gruberi TaxID=5762 RepID=D2UXI4_NAEGR|nr:uncharacterized protein NAEGRDRAFT_44951 [Naegleria gruberi]EFC50291.1 predicted protein [Naegleria gruberi]|eukprot:XP_002683035.1 predicted protein [Naegleria gruberi strain NEG-M]
MAAVIPLRSGYEFLQDTSSKLVDEGMTKVVVAMLMNHILPQLYVSQLSKFETFSVPSPLSIEGEENNDHFLLFEKEASTSGNNCSKCRYFENLAFSSSFNKYCQVNCTNCDCCNNSKELTLDSPTNNYNFDSYHQPIMVLPTSNNNHSSNETNTGNSQYVRDYLLNSLFQSDLHTGNSLSNMQQQTQNDKNYFLSNEGSTIQEPKNMVFPDINRKNQNEKKSMTILPQTTQTLYQNSFIETINNTHSSEEEDASSSSCLSNSSAFSNQSFNVKRESFISNERSWKVAFESEEYKGLLRNTSFKIKTRTDDIEVNISSQLYSSLKYQFNISTFINKKRATELAINQKSYGGIIIATVESLIVKNEEDDDTDEETLKKDEICQDVLKGESELALQPIESIEATESKAFKPFLQQLRREISKEDNDCDEREWICLLNKTKMQFSDQSQHNKKNSYVMRVSFYLNKEFKERKPIIIFDSAPFKIYARRSKKLDESEEPRKRKRKIKSKTTSKKQKSNDISLLSKFESELGELVQFIGEMTNSTERNRAVQAFITNLVSLESIQDRAEPIAPIHIDTSFGRQPGTAAKLLNERIPELNPYPFFDSTFYGNYSNREENSLESSISKDMLLSIGQSSVLDSPHTPDLMKGSESKPHQNHPPRILQLLNQPSSRLDLSKVKNIGSMNPSMLNKYLQDDVQTPTLMNSQQSNNLIGMENSLDIFDVSPLPIQGNISNSLPNETNAFDQLLFDIHRTQPKKEK